MLPNSASIVVKTEETEWLFEWTDFDGDDCFDNFRIVIKNVTETREFHFGGCIVWGLRKANRFFNDHTKTSVGGGFRNPDIRTYDIYREAHGYRLAIHFEGINLREEFYISSPNVQTDNKFMPVYDSPELN